MIRTYNIALDLLSEGAQISPASVFWHMQEDALLVACRRAGGVVLAEGKYERPKWSENLTIMRMDSTSARSIVPPVYDYGDVCCERLSPIFYASLDLVDGRPIEKRREEPIKPNDEKRFPQFAVFFVKLKQLRMDALRASQHAKRHIHIGGKLDLASLLQNLRSTELRGRHEDASIGRVENHDLSFDFHVSRSITSGGSTGSRRSTLCKRRRKSSRSASHVGSVRSIPGPEFQLA